MDSSEAVIEVCRPPIAARLTVTPEKRFLVEPRSALTDEIRQALQRFRPDVLEMTREADGADLPALCEQLRGLAEDLFAHELGEKVLPDYDHKLASYKRTLAVFCLACREQAEREKGQNQLALEIG